MGLIPSCVNSVSSHVIVWTCAQLCDIVIVLQNNQHLWFFWLKLGEHRQRKIGHRNTKGQQKIQQTEKTCKFGFATLVSKLKKKLNP